MKKKDISHSKSEHPVRIARLVLGLKEENLN